MATNNQRTVQLRVPGQCSLRCSPCDCRGGADSPERAEELLAGGGASVTLRGGSGVPAVVEGLAGRAREEGFDRVRLRTHAHTQTTQQAAEALARSGVDTVIIPLFSHVPKVHDRIAGMDGALSRSLLGARCCARAGLEVQIEVPILPPRLQNLTRLLELAKRTVPELARVHLQMSSQSLPAALAPAPWSLAAPGLVAALQYCDAEGIAVRLAPSDGVPICAFGASTETRDRHVRFDVRRKARADQCSHLPVCSRCPAKRACPGVNDAYARQNGDRDIVPLTSRPQSLYQAQTNQVQRPWTEARRAAARKTSLMVLRPTVNCNQDCGFCSANETSNNIWEDPDRMLKEISRAARRGTERISFSGGEPTLSKHLVSFIDAAHRLKFPYIELVTNAVLLDKPAKVKALVDAGLTDAFISLHAHDEDLSRRITQKRGDFDRTASAAGLLVDAGVIVCFNYVISSMNYRYLERYVRFVHDRYGGRTKISFAMVTPQFKALQNIDLVPRISDALPFLRRACYLALELGQPFIIGSRQGIPPCLLREFAPWSDLKNVAAEAQSEDSPQKQHAPQCDDCRYRKMCPGVWRPYVARYGLDELTPVPGEAFSPSEVEHITAYRHEAPWGVPKSFGEACSLLRRPEFESSLAETPEPVVESVSPRIELVRSRPLRVLMIGSGGQARRLAKAAAQISELSIDAVASPHAPDAGLAEFGHAPAYREAERAIEDIRPEAAIIAAATVEHKSLVELCLDRGVAVLVEKPVTGSRQVAQALAERAREQGVLLAPVHQLAHMPGVEALCSLGPLASVQVVRSTPPTSPDLPRRWERSSLYESLYHPLSLIAALGLGGLANPRWLRASSSERPEDLRLVLDPEGEGAVSAELVWDGRAEQDTLAVHVTTREGAKASLTRGRGSYLLDTGSGPAAVPRSGSDLYNLMTDFATAVMSGSPPRVQIEDALNVMTWLGESLSALEESGRSLQYEHNPRHARSRGLAPAYD